MTAESIANKASDAAQGTVESVEVNSKHLKHLSFVADTAAQITSAADTVYSTVRPFAPYFVEPVLTSVEDTVSAYGAPYVSTASDVGAKVLAKADSQVDYVAKTTSAIISKSKETIDTGKDKLFNTPIDDHVKTVQTLTSKYYTILLDAISPSKNIGRAKAKFQAALQAADKATDPDIALSSLQSAWSYVSSNSAVRFALTKVEPATKLGQSTFTWSHDVLVNNQYYKSAFDYSKGTLDWATSTTPYKLSSKYLYPWVKPVADPAIGKLSNSKSIGGAISYWKPTVTV